MKRIEEENGLKKSKIAQEVRIACLTLPMVMIMIVMYSPNKITPSLVKFPNLNKLQVRRKKEEARAKERLQEKEKEKVAESF